MSNKQDQKGFGVRWGRPRKTALKILREITVHRRNLEDDELQLLAACDVVGGSRYSMAKKGLIDQWPPGSCGALGPRDGMYRMSYSKLNLGQA